MFPRPSQLSVADPPLASPSIYINLSWTLAPQVKESENLRLKTIALNSQVLSTIWSKLTLVFVSPAPCATEIKHGEFRGS